MPRSTPPPQRTSFAPPNEVQTYRDLLMFEERLKTNAASLRRRKSKYELFLAQLILAILVLLSDVLFNTTFLTFPLNFFLNRIRPDRPLIIPPPYVTLGLLFIAVTTLVLFFASGLYTEKIGYANRYVPHANRALRSFNVYLNVRSPPLRSSLNPLSYMFPRASSQHQSPASTPGPAPRGSSPRRGSAIPPIPPTSNPRGELIFSSRVDPSFREGYERYRAAFERKREEQRRANQKSWYWFLWPRKSKSQQQSTPHIHVQHSSDVAGAGTRGRGRTPLTTTPSSSRSPTPRGSRKGRASRSATPLLEAALTKEKEVKVESLNFWLSGHEAPGS